MRISENQVIIDTFREAMFLELKEVGKETISCKTVPRYEWELPETPSNKWCVTVINEN